MSPTIVSAHAREILDSRGRPTVEVELRLSDGTTTRASVPSGASTGRHEAVERRDGDPERYGGRGVLRAVEAVNTEIAATIHGADVDLAAVDQTLIELDGTPDKSRLGANAILAVSLACARAEAAVAGQPLWRHLAAESEPVLPMPMVNVISGGLHAGRQLDFQDFLVMPVGAESYREALRTVIAVYEATADVLRERGLSVLKADEGGFGPALESPPRTSTTRAAAPTSSPRKAAPVQRRSSRPYSANWPTGTPCCRSRTRWPRTTGMAGRR
jgi:enolase